MARGGKREKAGRKSSWVSGCRFEDTKLIRVPSAIADQVLEFAHQLDSGEPVSETNSMVKPSRMAKRASSRLQGIACPECYSTHLGRDGFSKNNVQRYVCRDCGRKFVEHLAAKPLDSVTDSN
jgi:DNA-directed RNA polymerase subunit RPC12/RpoP